MWILKAIVPEKEQGVKANSNTANTNILLPLVEERKPRFLSQKWMASLMNFYILIYICFIVGEGVRWNERTDLYEREHEWLRGICDFHI